MKLAEYTEILRSKNAGPYCQTIDFVYSDSKKYETVKRCNALNPEVIAKLYKTDVKDVSVNYFDSALAVKVTIPRKHCCGSWRDGDCYGAQQHMPLMDLEFDPDS